MGTGKMVVMGAAVILALSLLATACSPAGPTTSTTKAASTTKTTKKAAASASTTSTSPVDDWTAVDYDQNTPGIKYAGGWTYSSAAAASGGAFEYVDKTGATVTFHFVGTYCGWLAKTSDVYGKALVSVDDAPSDTVDLYSQTVMWRHMVWDTKILPFGDHTVKIKWTGKKRTASKGTSINIDGIQVIGALVGDYQQSDSHLDYTGSWSTVKKPDASGGSFIITKVSKSSVTVTFKGIRLDWYAKQGPAYGKARVIVDDKDPVTIDLYSEEEVWQQKVWTTDQLKMGTHVVTIRWTGLKSTAATDTYINVDFFEIAGAVQ